MRALLLGFALAVIAAAPASAADQVVNATDAPGWDRPDVAVAPGEKVTWSFAGTTQAHNVQANGADVEDPDWTAFKSTTALSAPPVTFTFKTAGTYQFICEVHRTTMLGTVKVGDGAAPVVRIVPLSEQPFLSDDSAVLPLENVQLDKAAPKLTGLSAKRVARRAVRVRFRVSEESVVSVRFKRRGRTVKTVKTDARGLRGVTVPMRAGRYSVEVRATDIAGNRSARRTARVTVR